MLGMEVKLVEAEELAPILEEPKIEKTPYGVLKEYNNSAEAVVAEMLAMKKENKLKSELRQLVTQMFLNFVSLRQANRSILAEEDRIKSDTERAKESVDFTTLQLHNLLYEKNRYLKAIKACKDFKSKYPDIELVSEEEFFTDAPEEIKGTTTFNDSAHNLMLKRLNYELFQRKELCKLGEKLEQQKKGLLEMITNRKKFFLSLPSHLKSLKKASLPVHHQLGLPHTQKLKPQHQVELLPPPLYFIYSQFMAQKDAFRENIDLEIVGSLKDAQSFSHHQANRVNGANIVPPLSACLMPLAFPEPSTNLDTSKMADEFPDVEDDGQRSRKRPKKVPSKDSIDQKATYQAHPLRVIIHIYDDEDFDPKPSKLVTLKFEYLLNLNIVCIGIEGPDKEPENSILCNLFPDDDGLELPQQSAKLFLGDTKVFDEKRASRPYKWAQHLAGVGFLPEVSPMITGSENRNTESSSAVLSGLSLYWQQNRVQTVVKRVRSRIKVQMAHVYCVRLFVVCIVGHPKNPRPNVTALSTMDTEQRHDLSDVKLNSGSGIRRNDIKINREDGDLSTLLPVSKVFSPREGYNLKTPKVFALLTKGAWHLLSRPLNPQVLRSTKMSQI